MKVNVLSAKFEDQDQKPIAFADKIPVYCAHTDVVSVDDIVPNPKNPNTHPKDQIALLARIIKAHGWRAPITVSKRSGFVVRGHGRLMAALKLGVKEVPVDRQMYATEAEEYADLVADNRITELAELDVKSLDSIMSELKLQNYDLELTGYTKQALDELLNDLGQKKEKEEIKGEQPNPRDLPIDLIFTISGNAALCCMAVKAGWKYGIQSAAKGQERPVCQMCGKMGGHELVFIDNDYFDYNHELHLGVVKKYHPKYATVRDIMSKEQCAEAGIPYYSFEQIMEWAEEMSAHCDNVIVIPKYDCIKDIPDKYVLGYSVPSSHGATPMPIEAFKGRRIHLLGGPWKTQLAYLAKAGEDVVSLDNNHINRISDFGGFCYPDGKEAKLNVLLQDQMPTNPKYIALALSMGFIASKVNEVCKRKE